MRKDLIHFSPDYEYDCLNDCYKPTPEFQAKLDAIKPFVRTEDLLMRMKCQDPT